MKVIGITGGVGSGKSEVLNIIKEVCSCYIIKADDLAKSLEQKGQVCYQLLIELLGTGILDEDGQINPAQMAKCIFQADKDDKLQKVNDIIHPEVKKYILNSIKDKSEENIYEYFFIEAALLIEERYDLICDELWYIYADENVRIRRLKESRGYSDEKIRAIMNSQLDEENYKKYCKIVVNNSFLIEDTRKQIIEILEGKR